MKATQRLFFALWPDAATSVAVAALARDVAEHARGRATLRENIHLTLAFLGDQPSAIVPVLTEQMRAIEVSRFSLRLDQVGCWRRSGIAWLGAAEAPSELVSLHAELARIVGSLGIVVDDRPFAAHLTLARRIATSVHRSLDPPIAWPVETLTLVVSEPGKERPVYRVLESHPLARV